MCPHCCTLASLPTSGCRLLFAASTTSASKELHVLEEKVSPAWIGSATLCPTVNIARVKTHAEEAEGEHGKEQHLVCYVISLFSMRLCVLCFVLVCEALGLCSIPSPQMDDGPLVAATCYLHTESVLIFRFETKKDLLHTSCCHWGFSGFSTSDCLIQVTHPGLSQNASQQHRRAHPLYQKPLSGFLCGFSGGTFGFPLHSSAYSKLCQSFTGWASQEPPAAHFNQLSERPRLSFCTSSWYLASFLLWASPMCSTKGTFSFHMITCSVESEEMITSGQSLVCMMWSGNVDSQPGLCLWVPKLKVKREYGIWEAAVLLSSASSVRRVFHCAEDCGSEW